MQFDECVPTVIDRVIQQAILLRLQPLWDPTFSEHSYGFRPGRSAHQAVAQAQAYIIEGYRFVVDIDLAKFFDRVNHDRLMAAVAARVRPATYSRCAAAAPSSATPTSSSPLGVRTPVSIFAPSRSMRTARRPSRSAATPCPDGFAATARKSCRRSRNRALRRKFDFIFTCPPYADLEVYSDDPRDLSTLDYDEFRAAYANIIAGACALLKPDRFAYFVVGDVRDTKGFYRNFPGHTIEAFEAAGLRLYNEAILVTAVGSLPIRAGKQFAATRKLGKTHQECLVFVKGDPRKATEAIGEVEFGELASGQESPLPGVEVL